MLDDIDTSESPFTNPMTDDQRFEKEQQAAQFMCPETHLRHQIEVTDLLNLENLTLPEHKSPDENLLSSHDSINAILQSDLENIETDFEDGVIVKKAFKNTVIGGKLRPLDINKSGMSSNRSACFVSGNNNLVLNHLNDNFPQLSPKILTDSLNESTKNTSSPSGTSKQSHHLERKKLNQNLDNFSVRLESDNKNNLIEKPGSSKSQKQLPKDTATTDSLKM